jgi:membrane-associated protease RseP (regulator of RpoE activity)
MAPLKKPNACPRCFSTWLAAFENCIAAGSCVLVLSGCASSSVWYQEGKLDSEAERDLRDCKYDAVKHGYVQPSPYGDPIASGIAAGISQSFRQNDIIIACMEAKGYRRIPYAQSTRDNRMFPQAAVSNPATDPKPNVNGIGGIGVIVDPNPSGFLVLNVGTGGPAAKAGVKAGDIITEIDGLPTSGMEMDEGLTKLRGAIGTTVSLAVRRARSGLLTLRVTRDETTNLRYPQ